jgi:hypothetical protein
MSNLGGLKISSVSSSAVHQERLCQACGFAEGALEFEECLQGFLGAGNVAVSLV